MRRRQFITLLSGAAAWPLAARAQPTGKVARVGFLGNGPDNSISGPAYKAFLAELRKLGFTEGQNLAVEFRPADEGMPKAFTPGNEPAASWVEGHVAAGGTEPALQAAAAVRPALPIVMPANNFDPFARGYAASLARPG